MTTGRRRGEALESALLEAAWEELLEKGYGGLTMEAVARRAGTSRPVIYRRWSNRADLAVATLSYRIETNPIELPDTGNLREDLIGTLMSIVERRSRMGTLISLELTEFYSETKSSPADLKDKVVKRERHAMDAMLERAARRGEIETASLPPRIVALPTDLLRHEMMMTLKPATKRAVIEIVDLVFLPLVGYRDLRADKRISG